MIIGGHVMIPHMVVTPERTGGHFPLYARYIGISVAVVLCFALFQHLLVLRIAPEDIRITMLAVPSIVGGVFGYLLAKIRRMQMQSDSQLGVILEQDRKLLDKGHALEIANEELKAFSYSVSHDLRAPLRAIRGFSDALAEDCAERMDSECGRYVKRIESGCRRMEEMIDGLLTLSRVTQTELRRETLDLSAMAEDVLAELAAQEPGRALEVHVEPGMHVNADPRLLTVMMENLLQNAWKYTAGRDPARIRVYRRTGGHTPVYCVEDNGAGFDMRYADGLFTPFIRLHQEIEFPGSGIGLATSQRVVTRHGGRIWAEGKIDEGARFFFTLP